MPECDICHTALENRGTRLFCPACLLRDVMGDDDAEMTVINETSGIPEVPRYALTAKIGEGGFATVYRAMQMEPVQREVAVKVLKPQVASQQVLARFEAERKSMARMEHPGIARFWDSGVTTEGLPFFAMELVRGEPVTTYSTRLKLPLHDRLEIFSDICDAVQHAHEKGVLHRDLKPSNILVAGDGAARQVKIIDFGIAKALEAAPETAETGPMTAIHQTIGTPGYMSPEQAAWGAQSVDARSDLYALGVVLYEMITGSTPLQIEARANERARSRPVARHVTPPSQLSTALLARKMDRRDLDAITLKALAAEPAQRYASAAALAEDVRHHLRDEPVQAGERSWTYVMGKFTRRHRPFVVSSGLALLAVIGGFTVSTVMFFKEQQARSKAQQAQEIVEAREADLRRTLSRADFATAQRFKLDGDYQSAVACLARALRHDPTFAAAAADLQMLLIEENAPQPVAAEISLDQSWGEMLRSGVSASGRELAVVFKSSEGPLLLLFMQHDGAWQRREIRLTSDVESLAMSASGDVVCYADAGGRVSLLATRDEAAPEKMWLAPNPVTALSVSVVDGFAAAGCRDGSVWLLAQRDDFVPKLMGRMAGAVTHVQLGRRESGVVAAGSGGEVRRFDSTDSTREGLLLKLPAAITALAFASNSSIVAAGDAAGNVACRDGENAGRLPVMKLHDAGVTALALTTGGSSLISAGGGAGYHVKWLDLTTRTESRTALDSAGIVRHIWPTRAGDEALVVSADSSVRVWRQDAAAAGITIRKPQNARLVALSGAGQCMAVRRELGKSLETMQLSHQITLGVVLSVGRPQLRTEPGIKAMAFAQDGRSLIVAGGDASAMLWDSAKAALKGDAQWASPALGLAPSGGTMLAALRDGALIEVATDGAVPITRVPATQDLAWTLAAVSPDGRAAVWATLETEALASSRIRVWWADDDSMNEIKADRLSSIAVHGGTRTLALGLGNGHVRVIRDGGKRTNSLRPLHQTRVTSLNFSPDGGALITASTDGTAAVWDARLLVPLTDYFQLGSPVLHTAFSGDGRRFACVTGGEMMVGDLEVRALLGRPFRLNRIGGALALNHDGTRVAFTSPSGETVVHDIAPRSAPPAPEWFLNFAETFVSRRMTPQGTIERTDHPGLAVLRQHIPAGGEKDEWNRLARWLFTHTGQRTLTPWSELTLEDYISAVARRPGAGKEVEIRRLQPFRYRQADQAGDAAR